MKLSKAQREELRMKFGGRCAYCGCELSAKWHADHVEPVNRKTEYKPIDADDPWRRKLVTTAECWYPERDTIENLAPACPQCNNYKHAMSLETFRQQVGRQIEMLRAYSANFRTAERFGLVTAQERPIVFYFETFQISSPATSSTIEADAGGVARNQ